MKRNDLLLYMMIVFLGIILYVGLCKILSYPILGSRSYSRSYNIVTTSHEGESIPSIDILLPDSLSYTNVRNSSSGRAVVLFYFGPYCPYCREELKMIIGRIEQFRNIDFYLLTPYAFSEMRKFYDEFDLSRYSNIVVGVDYKYFFGKYFNTQNVPFLVIYNTRRVMAAAYQGVVDYNQIIELSK